MNQSRYMQLVDPNPKQNQPAKDISADLLNNKWVWIGAAGLMIWKGSSLLAAGAGFVAGIYVCQT